MAFEISTTWDGTLLEVVTVDTAPGMHDHDPPLAPGIVIAIREVPRPVRVLPYARGTDRRVVPYLAAALAVHLGIWALANAAPIEDPAPRRVPAARPPRASSISYSDPPSTEPPPPPGIGKPLAPPPSPIAKRDHVAIQNTGEEPQLAKAAAIAHARRAGILGDLQVTDETFRSLTGADAITSGFDAATTSATVDATANQFGLSAGTTHGHAWEPEPIAPRPAWHDTSWNGPYTYVNYHSTSHRGAYPSVLTICGAYRERCVVTGALDPAIVRRYVKRQVARFSYCYEKELLAKPDLATGVLTVDFTIRTDGHVESPTAMGLDATVASCVRDVLTQLEFPSDKTPTHVTYALPSSVSVLCARCARPDVPRDRRDRRSRVAGLRSARGTRRTGHRA